MKSPATVAETTKIKTGRTTKERAMEMVLHDLEHSGKPLSRRQYARIWNVPPSTAYYWIREACELHGDLSALDDCIAELERGRV